MVGRRKTTAMTASRAGSHQFSRYLRTRDKGPWTTIFHELHPEPWYIPTSTWRQLQGSSGLPPLAAAELQQRGLLVSSAEEDDTALAAAHAERRRQARPRQHPLPRPRPGLQLQLLVLPHPGPGA
jgi:hypothetical protein